MPTKVTWADETLNFYPGCNHVSSGCKNCCAERAAASPRLQQFDQYKKVITDGRWNGNTVFLEHLLNKPYSWKKPRRIFVNIMGDTFHYNNDFNNIFRFFKVMADPKNAHHTFILLTKRPNQMQMFYSHFDINHNTDVEEICWKNKPFCSIVDWPLRNLWVGITAETNQDLYNRLYDLSQVPAIVHFLSLEPLLGRIDLSNWLCKKIDWVIVGAESGSRDKRREMDLDWVRDIRNRCALHNIPLVFKQAYINGKRTELPLLDGQVYNQYPSI